MMLMVAGRDFTMTLKLNRGELVQYQVFNSVGKKIIGDIKFLKEGTHHIPVNMPVLDPGFYYLVVHGENIDHKEAIFLKP